MAKVIVHMNYRSCFRHVRAWASVEEDPTAVRLRNVWRVVIRNCGKRIPDAIWNLKEKQYGSPDCRSFIFSDARPFNDRVVHAKNFCTCGFFQAFYNGHSRPLNIISALLPSAFQEKNR